MYIVYKVYNVYILRAIGKRPNNLRVFWNSLKKKGGFLKSYNSNQLSHSSICHLHFPTIARSPSSSFPNTWARHLPMQLLNSPRSHMRIRQTSFPPHMTQASYKALDRLPLGICLLPFPLADKFHCLNSLFISIPKLGSCQQMYGKCVYRVW